MKIGLPTLCVAFFSAVLVPHWGDAAAAVYARENKPDALEEDRAYWGRFLQNDMMSMPVPPSPTSPMPPGSIKVAHVGNSIQYYGDTPRLLERMFKERYAEVVQDSCLRPGGTLSSVWDRGNNMAEIFATKNALLDDGTYDIGAPTVQVLFDAQEWDFVVLNDRSTRPPRPNERTRSLDTLENDYASAFPESATVILLQTAADRLGGTSERDTLDLGDFEEFTAKVQEGYEEYDSLLKSLNITSKIAPVGEAFANVRNENEELFTKLYSYDDLHPSPHGTWLQCCVLYCTMVGNEPPTYDNSWWDTARFMVDPPLPLPTDEEAEELRQVAIDVCGV